MHSFSDSPCGQGALCVAATHNYLIFGMSQGLVRVVPWSAPAADCGDASTVVLHASDATEHAVLAASKHSRAIDCVVACPWRKGDGGTDVAVLTSGSIVTCISVRPQDGQLRATIVDDGVGTVLMPVGCEYTTRCSAHCWIAPNRFAVGCFNGTVVCCEFDGHQTRCFAIVHEDSPIVQLFFSAPARQLVVSSLRRSTTASGVQMTEGDDIALVQIGTKPREEGYFGACYVGGSIDRVYTSRHNNRFFEADRNTGVVEKTYKVGDEVPLGIIRPLRLEGAQSDDETVLWSEGPTFCAVVILSPSTGSQCLWRHDCGPAVESEGSYYRHEVFVCSTFSFHFQFALTSTGRILIAPFDICLQSYGVDASDDPRLHDAFSASASALQDTLQVASPTGCAQSPESGVPMSTPLSEPGPERVPDAAAESHVVAKDFDEASTAACSDEPVVKPVTTKTRKVSIIKKVSIVKKKVPKKELSPPQGDAEFRSAQEEAEQCPAATVAEENAFVNATDRLPDQQQQPQPCPSIECVLPTDAATPVCTAAQNPESNSSTTTVNDVSSPPPSPSHPTAAVQVDDDTVEDSIVTEAHPLDAIAIPHAVVDMNPALPTASRCEQLHEDLTRLYRSYCARQLDKKAQPGMRSDIVEFVSQDEGCAIDILLQGSHAALQTVQDQLLVLMRASIDWTLHLVSFPPHERAATVRMLLHNLQKLDGFNADERAEISEVLVKHFGSHDAEHGWVNALSAHVVEQYHPNGAFPRFVGDGAQLSSLSSSLRNVGSRERLPLERLLLSGGDTSSAIDLLSVMKGPASSLRQYFPFLFAVLPSKALHLVLSHFSVLSMRYLQWALSAEVQTAVFEALRRLGCTQITDRMSVQELDEAMSDMVLLLLQEHKATLMDSLDAFSRTLGVLLSRRRNLAADPSPQAAKKRRRVADAIIDVVKATSVAVAPESHGSAVELLVRYEFPEAITEMADGVERAIDLCVGEGRIEKLFALMQLPPPAISDSHWVRLFTKCHASGILLDAVYLSLGALRNEAKRVRVLLRRAFPLVDSSDLVDEQQRVAMSKLNQMMGC